MQITIFKNFADKTNPYRISLHAAIQRIKNGNSRESIEKIRDKIAKNDSDYDVLKKSLPFVVFSAADTIAVEGKKGPTHREDASVTEHSGVFALDFDKCHVGNKIEQLKKDPYIYACWIAPSATGVKGLVKCPPNIKNHTLYYTAFLERYPELDTTSRNIARGTFESYDPNLYLNENSLVWDRQLSKEEHQKKKESFQNRRSTKILSTAVGMVRASYDGIKHETLRNAAILLGGYVATGRVDEEEAKKILLEEIAAKNPKDLSGAQQTILDGIAYGKSRPLHESKKIEKSMEFIRRIDGSYDFMADDAEMLEYELAVINGTLEMGLPSGLNELNNHWMLKKNHIVWMAGMDNVGKSFLVWYLSLLSAMFHNWKIVIHSAENSDGMVRKKLKEFYLGKSLKLADDEELTRAHDFVNEHYRIISSKQFHTLEDFLLKCEILYDEGFEFDVVVAEPWNAFDPPKNVDRYSYTIHGLNMLRVFKENYSSVWVCDHVTTSATRLKDKDGYVQAPWKTDVEMGTMKANKTDDFMIIHRVLNHPYKRNDTEIHVNKIKDIETGGFPTDKDAPVILLMNSDKCGYSCNGIDPIKEHRK